MRVYIVRHGETQENKDGIIQGQRDTSLNAVGLEQARLVGEALKGAKLGVAFSSDLSRAVKVRGYYYFRLLGRLVPCLADACSSSRPPRQYSSTTQGSVCASR